MLKNKIIVLICLIIIVIFVSLNIGLSHIFDYRYVVTFFGYNKCVDGVCRYINFDGSHSYYDDMGGCYMKNKNNTYIKPIMKCWEMGCYPMKTEIDTESFKHLSDSVYAIDRNNVYHYYLCNVISGIDIPTFEVINSYYAKDKNNAYYDGYVIKGVDLETFKVIDTHSAKDKNYKYNREFKSVSSQENNE